MEETPLAQDRAADRGRGPHATNERWQRIALKIPNFAVIVVVFTAVTTTWVLTRNPPERDEHPAVPAASPVKALSAVVTAPPLSKAAGPREDTSPALNRAPEAERSACRECGVVESVVALKRPRDAVAYQMRIRMDDGSVRTVEQRGALAAGSRVVVARGSVRPANGPG
jgi:hypothetical protein